MKWMAWTIKLHGYAYNLQVRVIDNLILVYVCGMIKLLKFKVQEDILCKCIITDIVNKSQDKYCL